MLTHRPARTLFLTGCLAMGVGLLVAALIPGCAALTAAEPLVAAAAPGLVQVVEDELRQAQVPPTDPAYTAAVKAAQALEAKQSATAAEQGKQLAAILAAVRAHKPAPCPVADAGVATTSIADASVPKVAPVDAGRDAP